MINNTSPKHSSLVNIYNNSVQEEAEKELYNFLPAIRNKFALPSECDPDYVAMPLLSEAKEKNIDKDEIVKCVILITDSKNEFIKKKSLLEEKVESFTKNLITLNSQLISPETLIELRKKLIDECNNANKLLKKSVREIIELNTAEIPETIKSRFALIQQLLDIDTKEKLDTIHKKSKRQAESNIENNLIKRFKPQALAPNLIQEQASEVCTIQPSSPNLFQTNSTFILRSKITERLVNFLDDSRNSLSNSNQADILILLANSFNIDKILSNPPQKELGVYQELKLKLSFYALKLSPQNKTAISFHKTLTDIHSKFNLLSIKVDFLKSIRNQDLNLKNAFLQFFAGPQMRFIDKVFDDVAIEFLYQIAIHKQLAFLQPIYTIFKDEINQHKSRLPSELVEKFNTLDKDHSPQIQNGPQ